MRQSKMTIRLLRLGNVGFGDPTLLQQIHPDDRVLVQQLIDGASNDAPNLDDEYRLLMPDSRVKYVRTLRGKAGPEFTGALTYDGWNGRGRDRTQTGRRPYRANFRASGNSDLSPATVDCALFRRIGLKS
jgi:hypothetical protein